MFNLILSASWEHSKTDNAHILNINVLTNWQLSKQGTCWPVSLDLIAGSGVDPSRSSTNFGEFIWNMLCFCAAQLKFWFKTDLGPENSASYYRQDSGFDFAHHGHALVTLYVHFLCSDWSKFDRWAHAENLCSILNLVYFDRWSWQSFVSSCDVFNCLFPLDAQNEIQLLSGVFRYSWLVGFWLRN